MESSDISLNSCLQREHQNVDIKSSSYSGLKGIFETFLRKFRTICFIMALLPLYSLGAVCMGIGILPGAYLFTRVYATTQNWPLPLHLLLLSISLGIAYVLYGFTLILIVPQINRVLRVKPKPWRGIYFSLKTIPWYIHNGLTYLLRYTFLRFVTPSPWSVYFYRAMGMKIGQGSLVNTTNISDPALIELGRKVTIGGSATIIGHYARGGFLIIAPVIIQDGAAIGMRSIIMGDVEIGENAKVLPNSVVMPRTRIPAGETWCGVPAQPLHKLKGIQFDDNDIPCI